MKNYKILLIVFILLLRLSNIYSQSNNRLNPLIDNGYKEYIESIILTPKTYNNYIDIRKKSQAKRFIVKTLVIDGLSVSNFPLYSRFIVKKSLTIKNCNWLDAYLIFKAIEPSSNLENISFENIRSHKKNEITLRFKSLKNLSFTNCDSLCNKELFKKLNSSTKFNSIDMTGNKLESIPDLSYLQIDSLFLKNNPDLNIANKRNLLPKSLKYIEIDNPDTTTNNNPDYSSQFPGVSVSTNKIDRVKIEEKPKRKYGVIKVSKQDQLLYSGAYTKFASIYQGNPYNVSFDTLLFDDRFEDLSYKRLYRNNTFISRYFLKILSKKYNNNVCFELIDLKHVKKYKLLLNYDFPEYSTIRRYAWVLDAPIKKSVFYKMYKKRKWVDFRLKYDDGSNSFTIIFKDDTSFFSINAKPLIERKLDKPNIANENYKKIFLDYEKSLDRRRLNYNKRIIKDYTLFKERKQRYNDSCWVIFRNLYMSEAEKQMKKEEWFEYYENIIANENNILRQSEINQLILCRALDIIGFKDNKTGFNISTLNVKFKLVDNENRVLSVNKATVIDLQYLRYYNFMGGLGYDQANLYLNPTNKYAIYAELLNGDIAVVKPEDINLGSNDIYTNVLFKATIIEKGLNSLDQILFYFGLKL